MLRTLLAAAFALAFIWIAGATPAAAGGTAELTEGWTLVTYEGSVASAGRIARVLAARSGGQAALSVYDPAAHEWRAHYSDGPSLANSLPALIPGHDYWVFVPAETSWEFQDGPLDLIAFTLTGTVEEEDLHLGPEPTGDARTAVVVVRPEGGATATLAAFDGTTGGIAWSHAGTRVAWCSEDGLYLAFADGTGRESLHDDACSQPAWSDDDRYIAFVDPASAGADILRVNTGTGQIANLTRNPAGNFEEPTWRPGSAEVYAIRRGSTQTFSDDDVVRVSEDEQPERVLGGLRRDLAFSPDGDLLYTTHQQGENTWSRAFDLAAGEEETLFSDTAALSSSPDGRYYAWQTSTALRIRQTGGGDVLQPVSTDAVHTHSWSPTSAQLAVIMDERLQKGLLAVTDRDGPPRVIAQYPPLNVTNATWSPR